MKQVRLTKNRDQAEYRQLAAGDDGPNIVIPPPGKGYIEPPPGKTLSGQEYGPGEREEKLQELEEGIPKEKWQNKKLWSGGMFGWTPEYLADEELEGITQGNVNKFLKSVRHILFNSNMGQSFIEAAQGGKSKKGWYRNFTEVLPKLFPNPDDYMRFSALLASTSPRTAVNKNLNLALDVWSEWNEIGRKHPDAHSVLHWLKNLADKWGEKQDGKVMVKDEQGNISSVPWGGTPWFGTIAHNVARSLLYQGDWSQFKLSGLKVQSFWSNITGNLGRSTNDVWMSDLGGVSQELFGKKPGYAAMNSVMRMATDKLNQTRGPGEEAWSTAEVQETGWSFIRALSWLQGAKDLRSHEALAQITHGHVLGNTDFLKAASEDNNVRRRLISLGLGKEADNLRSFYQQLSQEKAQTANTPAVTGTNDVLRAIARTAGRKAGPFRQGRLELQAQGQPLRYQESQGVKQTPILSPTSTPVSIADAEDMGAGEQDPWTFFSPNQDEGLSFDQAWKRLNSSNQKAARSISEDMLHAARVTDYKLFDAVGDWEDGAENSLVYVMHKADPDLSRYLAAWQGLVTNQKAVLHFQSDPSGQDSIYQVSVPISSVAEVREKLAKFGISFRTIIPRGDYNIVMVYDQNRGLHDSIGRFVEDVNATVRETYGRGEFIGSSARHPSRADARRQYRRIIEQFESGEPQPKPTDQAAVGGGEQAPVDDPTGSVRLSRRAVRVRYEAGDKRGLVDFTTPHGTIPLYHYSQNYGDELLVDPQQFGQNPWTQREKKSAGTPRSFFYLDLKNKEKNYFGPSTPLFKSEISATSVYDLMNDPQNLKDGVYNMDDLLAKVRDAGYSAVYYNNGMHLISALAPIKARRTMEDRELAEQGISEEEMYPKKAAEEPLVADTQWTPERGPYIPPQPRTRKMSKKGRVVRLASRKAPEGGMAWRGLYYPGGQYIPAPTNAPIGGLQQAQATTINAPPILSPTSTPQQEDQSFFPEGGEGTQPNPQGMVYRGTYQPKEIPPIDKGVAEVAFDHVSDEVHEDRRGKLTEDLHYVMVRDLGRSMQDHGINSSHVSQYKETLKGVIADMSPTALERASLGISRMHFFPDLKALNAQARKLWPGHFGEGVVVGGIHAGGKLYWDGGVLADEYPFHEGVAGPGSTARGIYAHEMAHAVDGTFSEYSSSQSWQDIWAKEIQGGNLSTYAATSTDEGFAEFYRAILSPHLSGQELEKHFPRTVRFFKYHHLWPKNRREEAA